MNNKISKETIIRTIILVIALINQTLTGLGKNPLPFAEETIYEAATLFVTIAATLWAWWKNNSFTKNAIVADKYLADLKLAEKVDAELKKGDDAE